MICHPERSPTVPSPPRGTREREGEVEGSWGSRGREKERLLYGFGFSSVFFSSGFFS